MPNSPVTERLRNCISGTAQRLGPEAPTLCPPWTVRDLLAHLVLRESRLDALPGIGVGIPALQRHTAKLQEELAAGDFDQLRAQVSQGPARWWPTNIPGVRELANVPEFVIHHEDMVRAQAGWKPTDFGAEVSARLWRGLDSIGKVLYRSAPTGVVLIATGFGRVAVRRPPAGRPGMQPGSVILRGTPLELTLHTSGRTSVAEVSTEGADADLAALSKHIRAM